MRNVLIRALSVLSGVSNVITDRAISVYQEIFWYTPPHFCSYFPHPYAMDRPRRHVCGPSYLFDPQRRTSFTPTAAAIYAWPSRGGVIILDNADAIDLEFLNLDPLDPPPKRLDRQAEEDAFSQRLLHLGAKWWDSEARYIIVSVMETGDVIGGRIHGAFPIDEQPKPTMREKRLVLVGWPSTGGVWIADFDTTWAGVDEDNLCDEDVGRLKMARTMNERCALLRDRFGATFYEDVKDYDGYGFFNAWQWKTTGEVGPLLSPSETADLWSRAYNNRSGLNNSKRGQHKDVVAVTTNSSDP